MKNDTIKKDVHPFEVEVHDDFFPIGKNTIYDIYITELGYVMISVYNEDKKVYVNYICKKLKDILPENIKLKEVGGHQSFVQQISKDDK
jgi:hypothetical protein